MLDRLKALIQGHEEPSPRLSEIQRDEPMAVCAILMEVAEADYDFAPDERSTIEHLVAERYGMDEAEVDKLIQETRAERERMPDLWSFTNAIARKYGPEDKQQILVMVWRVILSDGTLNAYEDQLAARLRAMLSVNHSVLIAAKQQAREAIAGEQG